MQAMRVGIAPDQFWALTPFLLRLAAKSYAMRIDDEMQRGLWFAWHAALLQRMKKLIDLKKLLQGFSKPARDPGPPRPQIDEQALFARFEAHSKQVRERQAHNGNGSPA